MTEQKTEKNLPLTQREWFKNLLWMIVMIGIFLIARSFMQGDVVQGKAPHFNTTSITGQSIDLSDYQGQPVLVHFWATWCPICEFEIEGIERVAESYPVINIATQSGSNEELLAYAQQHGMNPNLIVNDEDGALMRLYQAQATPTSFILNPNGEIEFVEVGYSTSIGLKARLWFLQ
jgi:thiol-disulfide isomerase/thioredoxin